MYGMVCRTARIGRHRRTQSVPRLRAGLPLCQGRQQRGRARGGARTGQGHRPSDRPACAHAQGIGAGRRGRGGRARRGPLRGEPLAGTAVLRRRPPARGTEILRRDGDAGAGGAVRHGAGPGRHLPRHPRVERHHPGVPRACRRALRGHRHRGGACGRLRLRHRQGRRASGAGHVGHVLPAHLRPAAGAGPDRHAGHAARVRRRHLRRR